MFKNEILKKKKKKKKKSEILMCKKLKITKDTKF